MKYLLLLVLFSTLSIKAQVQKIKLPDIYQTKQIKSISTPSNQTFNLDVKHPKSKTEQIGNATVTSNIAIYKSNQLPVYQTKSGKLFIVYENKDNTGYNKKYINPINYSK